MLLLSGVLICRGGTPWPPPLHRLIQVPTQLAKKGVATECHPYKLEHYIALEVGYTNSSHFGKLRFTPPAITVGNDTLSLR